MSCCVFQSEVRYNLVGYFPGTLYFTLNTVTGDIVLRQSFANDLYASLLYVVSCPPLLATLPCSELSTPSCNPSLLYVVSCPPCSAANDSVPLSPSTHQLSMILSPCRPPDACRGLRGPAARHPSGGERAD